MPSMAELLGQVQAKESKTEEISRLEEIVKTATGHLDIATTQRNTLKGILRQTRKDGGGNVYCMFYSHCFA